MLRDMVSVRERCAPRERAQLREKARVEPLAYREMLFEFRSTNWQLRRIENIMCCEKTSCRIEHQSKISRKRVKRAKPSVIQEPPDIVKPRVEPQVTQPHHVPPSVFVARWRRTDEQTATVGSFRTERSPQSWTTTRPASGYRSSSARICAYMRVMGGSLGAR